LDCLVVDVHPWSGALNLSLRLTEDEHGVWGSHGVNVADWRYSHFASADPECDSEGLSEPDAWPEGNPVAAEIRRLFRDHAEQNLDVTDDQRACAFYRMCLAALGDAKLQGQIGNLPRSREFQILVPNVDHPSRTLSIPERSLHAAKKKKKPTTKKTAKKKTAKKKTAKKKTAKKKTTKKKTAKKKTTTKKAAKKKR
tara:strand:+ start:5151 stop:5741 length:591 start_codon:yes stop_codon:yes gene_type:complete